MNVEDCGKKRRAASQVGKETEDRENGVRKSVGRAGTYNTT